MTCFRCNRRDNNWTVQFVVEGILACKRTDSFDNFRDAEFNSHTRIVRIMLSIPAVPLILYNGVYAECTARHLAQATFALKGMSLFVICSINLGSGS